MGKWWAAVFCAFSSLLIVAGVFIYGESSTPPVWTQSVLDCIKENTHQTEFSPYIESTVIDLGKEYGGVQVALHCTDSVFGKCLAADVRDDCETLLLDELRSFNAHLGKRIHAPKAIGKRNAVLEKCRDKAAPLSQKRQLSFLLWCNDGAERAYAVELLLLESRAVRNTKIEANTLK